MIETLIAVAELFSKKVQSFSLPITLYVPHSVYQSLKL